MDRGTGTVVMAIGAAIVVLGLAIRVGALSWFGRLPGDVRIETSTTRVFVPITSMVVASVVATVVVNLLTRWR